MYIAGYVVRAVVKRLKCSSCVDALTTSASSRYSANQYLLTIRNNGGLVTPCSDVVRVESM